MYQTYEHAKVQMCIRQTFNKIQHCVGIPLFKLFFMIFENNACRLRTKSDFMISNEHVKVQNQNIKIEKIQC